VLKEVARKKQKNGTILRLYGWLFGIVKFNTFIEESGVAVRELQEQISKKCRKMNGPLRVWMHNSAVLEIATGVHCLNTASRANIPFV
jgi:hypothetical protein